MPYLRELPVFLKSVSASRYAIMNTMTLVLAHRSLSGLSVGDALGAQFFVPGTSVDELVQGRPPVGPWPWTDDTEMACNVVAELSERGTIDQDALARAFSQRYDPYRGYGPGTVVLLHQIRDGAPWLATSSAAFGGEGSRGNGAAMRVAPLGAYFAGEPVKAAREAALSAQVTHFHQEGVCGAIAVAVASSIVGGEQTSDLIGDVLVHVPDGRVRDGLLRARRLLGRSAEEVAYELGNGAQVTAVDTVPFCLWVAATHLLDYRSAIVTCIQSGGDIDTTAAIVGGIVGVVSEVPREWVKSREPLPMWLETI